MFPVEVLDFLKFCFIFKGHNIEKYCISEAVWWVFHTVVEKALHDFSVFSLALEWFFPYIMMIKRNKYSFEECYVGNVRLKSIFSIENIQWGLYCNPGQGVLNVWLSSTDNPWDTVYIDDAYSSFHFSIFKGKLQERLYLMRTYWSSTIVQCGRHSVHTNETQLNLKQR